MLSFQEIAAKKDVKKYAQENARRDHVRRECVREFTRRLNEERNRENEGKIEAYMWDRRVSRETAVKVLKNEKDKSKKIWPLHTERAIHFKTCHLSEGDLRDFLDMCNAAEKDKRSFGRCFFGRLKVPATSTPNI